MDTFTEPEAAHGTPEKLVYMANQIARFFSSQGSESSAASQTAEHIVAFWAPAMRVQLLADIDRKGAKDLSPIARAAAEHLRR